MIRGIIEFFFLFWVPFVVTIFLVALISLLALTGKFNKEEPVMDVSEHVDIVEEYYADDDREVWYIRKNYVSGKPYHFTVHFYGGETEYVRLFLNRDEIEVKIVELEEDD